MRHIGALSCGAVMLSVDDALAALLSSVCPVGQTEPVAIAQAFRRVLALDLYAGMAVPPEDNSAVDGYAFALADLETSIPHGGLLLGRARHAAGASSAPLIPRHAVRIFTGATIPDGADTVAMQEDCSIGGGRLSVTKALHRGENIRRRGEDIAPGALVLEQGRRLSAQDLATAAALGQARLHVYRRIRVGVLCTGDELVPPGIPLSPGKIYSSNDLMLAGLLTGMGCELSGVETVADDPAATAAALDRLARSSDAVITSGGVSVGEEDYVKTALERCGHIEWWKVAIKPGKPFVYGRAMGTPVLGLPGNPTSLFVTFCILVRPLLLRLQGAGDVVPLALSLPACFARTAGERREYLRVRIAEVDGRLGLVLAGPQGSASLGPLSRAHGLAVLPERGTVRPGDPLSYLPFEHLLN